MARSSRPALPVEGEDGPTGKTPRPLENEDRGENRGFWEPGPKEGKPWMDLVRTVQN